MSEISIHLESSDYQKINLLWCDENNVQQKDFLVISCSREKPRIYGLYINNIKLAEMVGKDA